MAVDEPEIAEDLRKKILEPNEIDEIFAQGIIPMNEVKFYPGSEKGRFPEDDPENYSKWFYENQAPSTLDEYGSVPIELLGGKRKFVRMV